MLPNLRWTSIQDYNFIWSGQHVWCWRAGDGEYYFPRDMLACQIPFEITDVIGVAIDPDARYAAIKLHNKNDHGCCAHALVFMTTSAQLIRMKFSYVELAFPANWIVLKNIQSLAACASEPAQ